MKTESRSTTGNGTKERAARLIVRVEGHRVAVKGDLDDSAEAYKALTKGLSAIRQSDGTWEIDAAEARVAPAGITTWITAARDLPVTVQLHYLDDYLGYVLQFDERYDRSHSSFEREI